MALQQPKSIIKDKPIHPSMDFSFLKREGIEEIQRLSGRIWTDYNEHDPGVTILENLCYALTELGYKTNFSIQDLFFKKSSEDDQDFLKTFYGPKEILPPAPLTITDFRRILIDHVTGIKNIWIIPKKQSVIGTRINGLYEVLVMVDESLKDHKPAIEEVNSILQENRNLGEDFENVRVLEFEPIHFTASISISPDAIGESIYAEILTQIQEYFSPIIPLYSEDEMLDLGFNYEYIHNHPPVKNGFVLEEDLINSELHHVNKLFRSNLIRIISEIEGVDEVFDFSVYVNNELIQTEIIQLEEYKIPVLNTEKIIQDRSISLVAGDIPYSPDQEVVRYTFEIEKSRSAVKHKRFLEKPLEDIKSSLKKEEIETYYSIQNSFPRTYGITDFGIQGKVSSTRKAQVNQLRAYLFFFEQIMANYLAQLSNVDKLFSTKENLEHTYFYQHLTHVNGYQDIIKSYNGTGDIPLDKINSKFDRVKERRNRLLDHMLARFGEEFLLEAYNAIYRESSSVAKTNFLDQSITAKNTFLNNYLEISHNKAKGFNHSIDYKDPENVSGLEKKISLLFNFSEYGFKRLSDLTQEKNLSISNKVEKSDAKKISFNSKNPNILADILAFGTERTNYRIDKNTKEYVLEFENPALREKIEIYSSKTIKECEDALSNLIEKLTNYNNISEGFHVLEHILLRDINSSFRFIYISESNVELTSPYNYNDSETDRIKFVEELLEIGVKKVNYTVKKDGDFYRIIISQKGKTFQVKSNEMIDKSSAESAIDDLVTEFKATKSTDQDLELRLHLDQDMSNVSVYDEDPYSLQLSFICPAWSGRFRSDKMKYLFENVVKINSPAHLKLNFFWLTLDEMKDFEAYFEKWLAGKNDSKFDRKTLDKISKVLLLQLKQYALEKEDSNISKELKAAKDALK